ncbi:MAG: hypothetical protein KGH93_00020 [Patescibacteria group bacterium]|nr:hypothetical protein [Patescibacteria group bacterium]MDE1945584.1 hypothetical protein [Patescibacteria group bacterium]
MQNFVWKTVLTGILWGIWPLMMTKSGLKGIPSTFIFTGVMFAVALPLFVFGNMKNAFAGTNLTLAIAAGILGIVGTLLFNEMLADAPGNKVTLLIVLMIITETVVPAVYYAYNNGFPLKRMIGFALAGLSAAFLTL